MILGIVAAKKNSGEDQLTDIAGVGKARAKKLKKAGIDSPSKLAAASVDDVHDAGISGSTAKKLVEAARKHEGLEKVPAESAGIEQRSPDLPPRPSRFSRFGVAAAVVLVVALGVLFATGSLDGVFSASSQPVAAVNGEIITESELDAQYSGLPADMQEQYSKQQVLSQLVDKQLILQHAREQGVSVSDADVEARIDEQVQQLGVSRDQLTQVLAGGNVTLSEYKQAVREELVLQRLLDRLSADVDLSDEQVRAAYEQLPEESRSSYEEMEPRLRQALEQRVARQEFSDLIERLRSEADIDYYGEYQSLAQQ